MLFLKIVPSYSSFLGNNTACSYDACFCKRNVLKSVRGIMLFWKGSQMYSIHAFPSILMFWSTQGQAFSQRKSLPIYEDLWVVEAEGLNPERASSCWLVQ